MFSFSSQARVLCRFCRSVSYIQGQSPTPKTREYFYYIDHQGQLFLDDTKVKNFITCFKDKKFLAFFFRRLRVNSTGHYEDDFPFVSPCGPETNYIRCDDLPLVFTHILDQHRKVIEDISSHALNLVPLGQTESETELLSYGGTGSLLTVPFQPQKLSMLPGSGRVYHIGPSPAGGVGLVKSSLALELSPFFEYRNKEDPENSSPVRFRWRGKAHDLDDSVLTYLLPRQPNDRHS